MVMPNKILDARRRPLFFALFAFSAIFASPACEHQQATYLQPQSLPANLQPQSLEEVLTKLAAGVYVKIFDDLLGTPTFVNEYGAVQERIYVFDEAYVQAIVDGKHAVLAFSVTTRTDSFNPAFYFWNGTDRHVVVRLGKTRFSELNEMFGGPDSYTGFVGARRVFYAEQLYLGNPSNYQYFVFAFNDAGYSNENSDLGALTDLPIEASEGWVTDISPKVQPFRSSTTINTLMITAPSVDPESILNGPTAGPDYDQVRVLETTKPPSRR